VPENGETSTFTTADAPGHESGVCFSLDGPYANQSKRLLERFGAQQRRLATVVEPDEEPVKVVADEGEGPASVASEQVPASLIEDLL
jgi:hypothetical protein